MQGRLVEQFKNKIQSFPMNNWKKEFELANDCDLKIIEWIFDENTPNPIMTSNGIQEIKQLMRKNDIEINTICGDYFMIKKLFNESELITVSTHYGTSYSLHIRSLHRKIFDKLNKNKYFLVKK